MLSNESRRMHEIWAYSPPSINVTPISVNPV